MVMQSKEDIGRVSIRVTRSCVLCNNEWKHLQEW
jgi:hypothetical protein